MLYQPVLYVLPRFATNFIIDSILFPIQSLIMRLNSQWLLALKDHHAH